MVDAGEEAAIWGFKITMTLLPSLIKKRHFYPWSCKEHMPFYPKNCSFSKKITLYAIINDEVVWFWTQGGNIQNTL